MSVVGCESMLAQNCAYEAMTTQVLKDYYSWDPAGEFPRPNRRPRRRKNALKNLAAQFYYMPAVQVSKHAVCAQPSEAESLWSQFKVVEDAKGTA